MQSRSNSIFNIFTLCVIVLLILGTALTVYPVQAQSFSVSNATELIQAINDANINGQDDTITLTADIALTTVDNSTDGVNGLPSILSDGGHSLTIEGNGFSIQRSGAPAFRIIHIATGANAFLRNLSIENGLANAGGFGTLGAGIYSAGTLTVENSAFSGNTATTSSGLGAGIFINQGTFILKNSYFTNNSGAMGAALYNYQNTAIITGNTFTGNTATNGGGAIADENSNTTLINNTLSGNQSPSGHGGAIYRLGGTSVMTNNTVSGNTSGFDGGGIYNLTGTVTLHNNIIAGNTAPGSANCYNDTSFGSGSINGNSFNLFGVNGNAGGCPAGASDIVPAGALASIINTLSNNGGPTMTIPLSVGSPALNAAGNGNCPATDQRGAARPQNSICDIGAFEYGASIPPVVTSISLPGPIPLLESQSTTLGITQIIVRFDQDVTSGGSATAADNPSNYLLVRAGGNGFQTQSCASGVTGSDVNISIDSVTYTNNGGSGPFEATLNLNNGNPLPVGMYELFVCGTTSITNIFGEELNGGWVDFDQVFSVVTQQIPTVNHTVAFNANGGSGLMNDQVASSATALTINTFTRNGYSFSGWNTAANGSGTTYADGAIYDFSADVTLYAQWTAVNHTVTFNVNGGSGLMSEQVASSPTALTINTFTRNGYSFSGWNTAANGSGTSYADGAIYDFSADVTLYAQWTAVNHTVTFNANDGSGSMSPQVNNLPAALSANAFTRTGFSFSGWNTAANGSGTSYADGATYDFSADVTLYAQWAVLTPTFADVPLDYWSWQYIESLYNSGITGGCSTNPLNYCPTSSVTRAQMAVFLLKGIHGSSFAPPVVNGSTGFNDVAADYWAAAWIKQLAAEGITGGCGNGNYCPENTVTRDQMAVFLLKTKYGSSYAPPAVNGDTGFTDVPVDYWAAAWIKQLAAEAITGGCGGGLYCPSNPVTRDQMAVFLQKTFNLSLP